MELELQNDLIEYVNTKSSFYKEMMHEYYTRLHNFSGTDEFGNALEEIPINALISSTFNHNTLVQAVSASAQLYRDFRGLAETSPDTFQQFTTGAPFIKDETLYNAYSLSVRQMLRIFRDVLQQTEQHPKRPVLHLGKNLSFYFEGRSHDVIYQPLTGGLPKKIVQVLYENFKKKPLTSGGLIMRIDSKKKLSPQDITSSIKDINEAFSRSAQLDRPIIINSSGYLLNDRYFEFVLD